MNYQTHNDGQNNQRHITVAANHRSYNHRSHDNAKERNKIAIYKKENTRVLQKETHPKKKKIHTSKKQCIREDPTQLLEDDNVHTGRKRSNKRRTRKTKKKNHLLTYLLIYLPAIATPIKTPFYSLLLLSPHTAIAPIPTSRPPINPKPCTRETHREGPALTLGAAAQKDKQGCTSRRANKPRHQHYYYFFFFFVFSLLSLLELSSASTSLVCLGLVSSRTPHAPL
jgi:hypothetical protein